MKIFSISKGIFFLLIFAPILLCANTNRIKIESPNKKINVSVWTSDGKIAYNVSFNGKEILNTSKLGLQTQSSDFATNLSFKDATANRKISHSFESVQGKRSQINLNVNERIISWVNPKNQKISIRFLVSDDGVVFKYLLPSYSPNTDYLTNELTTYNFFSDTKAWLQPMAIAKSGWEQTNPSYEEHYQKGIAVGTPEKTKSGWVYPALFENKNNWILITEAGLQRFNHASRLHHESPNGEYHVAMPDQREVIKDKNLHSKIEGDFETPWRVITIGNLKTIVESDLANAIVSSTHTKVKDFIKPGKASWSWISSKDDYITYDEQKKYIDFAADMRWQYCLIDVNWDTKIGYDKIEELSKYAKSKNVGLLLWYNSAGDWNTVGYTPKNKLTDRELRRKEFQKLKDLGIKGVKIDFFGGDGQSVIAYYIDILEDADEYELLVNFHGATLPRSWSTIYPHLMTVEAVRGFEMVTFSQEDADRQAEISSILPFTRNVYDPMDFTPMNLSKVRSSVKRKTTSTFELATSIVFLSGIQHYAESPEGMETVLLSIKDLLRNLPNHWQESKFLSGYPGKDIVVARKGNNKWYIAGINGEDKPKNIELDLSSLPCKEILIQIQDDENAESKVLTNVKYSKKITIPIKANGGFVIIAQ